MNYQEHLQKAIEYIEDNLTHELEVATCAKVCGYSEYHFLRIFKEAVKISPGDYIRKRRLTECAKDILEKKSYLADIGYYYGFNSSENFIRAFKTEHGIVPGDYKKVKNSLKLYEKKSFDVPVFQLKPEILYRKEKLLVVYPSDEKSPPKFWNKYNCRKLSKKLSGGSTCEDYGVSIWNGTLSYFIGIEKEQAKGSLSKTIEIAIPQGLYAVFTTPVTSQNNFVNMIHRTWEFINTVWLPVSNYERLWQPEFETYTEDSRSFQEKIFIPIQRKEK